MSQTFGRCLQRAKDLEEDLFPWDCVEIMEQEYGERMENMNPQTIRNKVTDMMGVINDCDHSECINTAVNNWLNNF